MREHAAQHREGSQVGAFLGKAYEHSLKQVESQAVKLVLHLPASNFK